MKKLIKLFTLAFAMVFTFTACSTESEVIGGADTSTEINVSDESSASETDEIEKINIVATTFSEYDWLKQIIGDNTDKFDLTMLVNSGVDLHSFQPTVDDIMTVSDSDMFVYISGESSSWVEDVLVGDVNENMMTIDLIDVLGDNVKSEVTVEGMQDDGHDHSEDEHTDEEHDHSEDEHAEDEHDHSEDEHAEDEHDHSEDEHSEEAHEHSHPDEHVWLSLRNAEVVVNYLSAQLGTLDPENADLYNSNAEAYVAELQALDQEYIDAVEAATYDTIIVGDRFPFRYLVDDYGINYHAAFPGCSAETEASFETITFLSTKLNETGIGSIIVLEDDTIQISDTIIESTENKDQEIVTMNSLQSVTTDEADSGVTYLSLMRENLEALKTALN